MSFLKIGHRGAAGYEPENTMRSFYKALGLGANAIEFDVRSTGSGHIVVIHDATVDRTTNGKGLVRDYTLANLRRLDAGKGEFIPTLSEVLACFKGKLILNIELKEEGIAEKVLFLIRHYNLEESVIVSAFDDSDNEPCDSSNWVDLLWLKHKETKIRIALLTEREDNLRRAIDIVSAYPVFAISPSSKTKDLFRFVQPINTHRALVTVWTANDPAEIQRLKDIGVDGIFSDYPDRL